jgi:hypothetical protein
VTASTKPSWTVRTPAVASNVSTCCEANLVLAWDTMEHRESDWQAVANRASRTKLVCVCVCIGCVSQLADLPNELLFVSASNMRSNGVKTVSIQYLRPSLYRMPSLGVQLTQNAEIGLWRMCLVCRSALSSNTSRCVSCRAETTPSTSTDKPLRRLAKLAARPSARREPTRDGPIPKSKSKATPAKPDATVDGERAKKVRMNLI